MTDVLRIALERRDQLHAEIQKLDEFIRMAEQLIRETQAAARAAEEVQPGLGSRMPVIRRGVAAAG